MEIEARVSVREYVLSMPETDVIHQRVDCFFMIHTLHGTVIV